MDGSVVMGPLTSPQWISTLSTCDRRRSGGFTDLSATIRVLRRSNNQNLLPVNL
jgi:hypothetical protein